MPALRINTTSQQFGQLHLKLFKDLNLLNLPSHLNASASFVDQYKLCLHKCLRKTKF